MLIIDLKNDLNLSIAELGAICNNMQTFGSDFANNEDVQNIVQNICDYVYRTLGEEYFYMWVDEFEVEL